MQHGRTPLPENNLDLLRSVAVLSVIASHAADFTGLTSNFTKWLGQSGVLAFFVHTSLVLMSSIERDDAPDRPGWVQRFYVRRAWRIYPLAWVTIALVMAVRMPPGSFATHYKPPSAPTLLANLALVQNLVGSDYLLSPLWTLPLELQMYLVLPLCFLVARRHSRVAMPALVAGALALAAFYAWAVVGLAYRPIGLLRVRVVEFAPCFLMGVTAYWLLRRRAQAGAEPRAKLPAWVWPAVIAVNVVGWAAVSHAWSTRVGFTAVLGLAIPMVRDVGRSLPTRVAHTIATYSYGIYLLHLPALRVGFDLLRGRPLPIQAFAATATLLASCYFAYHLVEKPGIALGRWLSGSRRVPLAAALEPVP